MACLLLVRLCVACVACAILADAQASVGEPTSVETVWVTDVVTSSILDASATIATGSAVLEAAPSVTSLLLAPPGFTLAPPLPASPRPSSEPIVVPITIPRPTTVTDIATDTLTATLTEPPATVTVPAAPVTVTEVVTISPMPPPAAFQTAWAAPAQMANLSAFNITYFPAGQHNLQILPGGPPHPGLATPDVLAAAACGNTSAASSDPPPRTPGAAVMQLFYPQDSIDPGNPDTPQGGADFYATPLDLRGARRVAMEYSVFFPRDFDWVQGGKLPGIYGGKVDCSGGDAAVTCFSTRLMWRAGGAGELYLYAPKDKQTKALCSTPPQSVCDAAYGLSVGRGSFYFAAGNWTRVRQTVTLNTPGVQDGGFLLEVNGQSVINRSDVFYRDAVAPSKTSATTTTTTTTTSATSSGNDGDSSSGSDSGGLLGGLLGGPLRIALWPQNNFLMLRDGADSAGRERMPVPAALAQKDPARAAVPNVPVELVPTLLQDTATVESTATTTSLSTMLPAPLIDFVTPVETSTAVAYPTAVPGKRLFAIDEVQQAEPVVFTGLFFSTFFGGHEKEYASPKDQFAWFSNFTMNIVA